LESALYSLSASRLEEIKNYKAKPRELRKKGRGRGGEWEQEKGKEVARRQYKVASTIFRKERGEMK